MAQPLDRPTKPRAQSSSQSTPPAKPPAGATGGGPNPPTSSPPRGAPPPPRKDRARLTSFLLGVLLGMTLMLATGTILWGFGILPIIEVYTDDGVCPQAAPFLPVCPTCAAACPTLVPHGGAGGTATATLTPPPNLAPTTTAACATFSSQFPGTPCP